MEVEVMLTPSIRWDGGIIAIEQSSLSSMPRLVVTKMRLRECTLDIRSLSTVAYQDIKNLGLCNEFVRLT